MFSDLGLKELIAPTAKAELGTSFKEVFYQYSRVNNPANGGEKVFAFDTLRLLEGVSETWKELYNTLAESRDELLEEKNNPEKGVDSRLHKAQGGLAFKRNQLNQLQENYSEQGIQLTKLEKKIATVKKESPTNVPTFTKRNPFRPGQGAQPIMPMGGTKNKSSNNPYSLVPIKISTSPHEIATFICCIRAQWLILMNNGWRPL